MKTAAKPTKTPEQFSLIPRTTQRALYKQVKRAIEAGDGEISHNDVAELAAAMAIRSSDVIVACRDSAGLCGLREDVLKVQTDGANAFADSVAAAVRQLCFAPATALALISVPCSGLRNQSRTLHLVGRSRLPLIFVTSTTLKPGNPRSSRLDLRTLYAEFGIPVITVDAHDAIAVYRVATEAAHNCRVGRGATILEATDVQTGGNGVASPQALECLENYMRRHGA